MVGQTEQALTAAGTPYEVGIARYREIARGLLIADPHGLLKLLFHPESRRLLGVHAIGTGATELIHIGQTVMAAGHADRLLRRVGLQLPDAGRVLQGRGAGRHQPRPPGLCGHIPDEAAPEPLQPPPRDVAKTTHGDAAGISLSRSLLPEQAADLVPGRRPSRLSDPGEQAVRRDRRHRRPIG